MARHGRRGERADRRADRPAERPCDRRPVQLREALFGGRDLFVRAFTEKLMMYALGRELKAYDMPQVRAVVRRAAAQTTGCRPSCGIVSSDAFRVQGRWIPGQ